MTARLRGLRRGDRWNTSFAVMAAAAALVLVVLGRGMTFFHDEWQFIDSRGAWDLATFLAPHNEHWSTVPVLIYKVLLETVGLRTYLPYQVVVVALHLAVAAALYVLLRREAGPLIGLCGAGLFLVLGTGNENLFWPAEIGWNAAAAAGAWALVLTLHGPHVQRPLIIAVLMLIAVASSGVGLFFLAVVALALLLTPERRRQLWILLPAVVAYAAWYLAIGRTAIGANVLAPGNLAAVPAYVVTGFGNAMGRLSGWGDQPGLVLAVLLTVATVWRLLSPRPLLVGALLGVVGVLVQFGITGLARASVGAEQAQSAHYVYTAAFFLLLAIGSWLAPLRIGWHRPRSVAVLGVIVAVGLAANLLALYVARSAFLERAEHTRAAITVMSQFGGSPAVPADRGHSPIPAPARLQQLLATYGSPLQDLLAPGQQPSAEALDRVLFELVRPSLSVSAAALPTNPLPLVAESSADLTVTAASGCLTLQSAGPDPQLVLSVPGGRSLFVLSTAGGAGRIFVSYFASFQDEASRQFTISPGSAVSISIPDLGEGTTWRVRLDPPASGVTRLCLG